MRKPAGQGPSATVTYQNYQQATSFGAIVNAYGAVPVNTKPPNTGKYLRKSKAANLLHTATGTSAAQTPQKQPTI